MTRSSESSASTSFSSSSSSSSSNSETELLSASSSISCRKTSSYVSSSCERYSKKKKRKCDKKKKNKKDKKIDKSSRYNKNKNNLNHENLTKVSSCNNDDNEAIFGPILPPHLQKKIQKQETTIIVGPMLPKELSTNSVKEGPNSIREDDKDDVDSDAAADMYGPMPVQYDGSTKVQMSAREIELEERALQLKMTAIDGNFGTQNITKNDVREEWMLELPDVGLKTGLAALGNLKRGFHQGKEKPDFSDRSAWTKKPKNSNDDDVLEKEKASTSKSVSLKNNAEAIYERQRDEEQERIAKKHKKKHKREESLVEMHQKKLRKEKKKKAKELAASGLKPERRPFSRDVDLKLNKIDKNQTKQIVDKAKILNTKFSSGKTKYL